MILNDYCNTYFCVSRATTAHAIAGRACWPRSLRASQRPSPQRPTHRTRSYGSWEERDMAVDEGKLGMRLKKPETLLEPLRRKAIEERKKIA